MVLGILFPTLNYFFSTLLFFFHASCTILLKSSNVLFNQPKKTTTSRLPPPEANGAEPILGHLRLLGSGNIPLCRKLGALADKYGPIFTLRLGMYQRILVVSSSEAVKDCFTTNDRVTAARPDFAVGKYLGYDYAVFSLDTDSAYWRKMRKFVVTELLSSQKLERLKHLRASEVGSSLRELYMLVTSSSRPIVDMNDWLRQLTLNLILTIVAGKRFKFKVKEDDDCPEFKEAQRITGVVKEFMYLTGNLVYGDAFPLSVVRWVELRRPVVKGMQRVMKELDGILQDWLDEHVARRERRRLEVNEAIKENDDRDFIDVMLSTINEDFARGLAYPRETIIKATALSMILDGSDTTAVHLTWLLSLLVNHADVMDRLRHEIDSKLGGAGGGRWAEDGDVKDMPYLHAVVKEALRLYPPLPTYAPHATTEDCKVGGYDVPRGTHVYVNAWKVHRDPRIWPDPDEFRPQRFLPGAGRGGSHHEHVPFGGGRRACIGSAYAMQATHLIIARLVQGFDFAAPSNGRLDMSEGLGITLPRAQPLDVVITPRLPPAFYGL